MLCAGPRAAGADPPSPANFHVDTHGFGRAHGDLAAAPHMDQGGDPAPDYSLVNENCLGAFGGPGGTDWTADWTGYPEGAAGL